MAFAASALIPPGSASPALPSARAAVWAHRLALGTAAATLVLIFVGGVVTNTGSGLAVPDWPTTFGRNMFLYPPSGWVGGILYEHSHRLIGAVVGLLTVALAVGVWVAYPRRGIRWLGLAGVAAVIAQGVLGGLRVVLLERTLAVVHGILAQGFFALVAALVLVTARDWDAPPRRTAADEALRRLTAVTTGLIYLQMMLGSVLAHTGAQLHAHLLLGVMVALQVFWLAARALGRHWDQAWLSRPARLLAGLVILQLLLGLGAYLGKFSALATAMPAALGLAFPVVHRVTGTLVLGTSLALTLRAQRMLGPAAPAGAGQSPARLSGEVAA